MKKIYLAVAIVAVLGILAWGISYITHYKPQPQPSAAVNSADEAAVRNVVTTFGSRLKMVPLLAPKAQAVQAIKDNYSGLVSADILNYWENDPSNALGRRTSSPWPDRIEIISIAAGADGSYDVQTQIIEVTSTGPAGGYSAALKLRKENGAWIITGIQAMMPDAG